MNNLREVLAVLQLKNGSILSYKLNLDSNILDAINVQLVQQNCGRRYGI